MRKFLKQWLIKQLRAWLEKLDPDIFHVVPIVIDDRNAQRLSFRLQIPIHECDGSFDRIDQYVLRGFDKMRDEMMNKILIEELIAIRYKTPECPGDCLVMEADMDVLIPRHRDEHYPPYEKWCRMTRL